MKTKMIFAIAAFLMLGSVCLKAQGNSNGSTSTDYSKQPFTIVPIDNDMIVRFVGHHSGTTDHFKLYWSYDEGETWDTFPYEGFEAWWLKVNLGQKLMIRAKPYEGDLGLIDVWDNINDDHSNNTKNGRFFIEGNLSSLNTSSYYGIFWTNHIYGCTNLVNAKNLILPNPTKAGQYKGLFYGCTGLLEAPVLSSATLTEKCYEDMFSGCTSLNYIKCLATDISATDCTKNWLDGVSPSGTFVKASSMNNWPSGASGIPSGWTVSNDGAAPSTPTDYSKQPFTIVPVDKDMRVLVWGNRGPHTTASVKMYRSYDLGQTWQSGISDGSWFDVNVGQKLTIKIEITTHGGSSGIRVENQNTGDTEVGKFYVEGNLGSMMHTEDGEGYFSGMTSLVSAENLIIPDNYTCESMFSGCTSLTTAPVLSASTLTENRYKDMFKGCSKLNYIKCLATDISASGCTDNWVYGVSPSGTFVKASSMNNWPSGASGIPSGWTVINDEATPSTPTDYSKQYLTFVAIEDGTFKYQYTSPTNALSYSLDNGKTWTALDYNTDTPTVARGKKIMWKGTCTSTNYGGIGKFISSGKFDVEGNIMSLLYGDNFINQTDLSIGSIYTFYTLFKGNTNMVNAENLVLPATTLKSHCYDSMFHSCSGLTTAPELPATSLAEGCYGDMFYGCTSLTTAPSLPATTLAMSCYGQMFNGCRSLTTAPSLPATTLASYCYYGMFGGCTSLTTAPSLPATTLAYACYCYMFTGCASLTTAPSLPATTLAYACYFEMFGSCTSLTTAPVLSATSLAEKCYQYMFSRCSKLDYVKCLAIDISAPNCTENWVEGVSSSGTFVKASSMNSWTRGASGIPSGWTITNAQNSKIKRTIHVATAGTLPNLISEDEKYQIEELTLTGELNGTDIHLIRDMAGINMDKMETEYMPTVNSRTRTQGKLNLLDLSDANIVEGGRDYYRQTNDNNFTFNQLYTKANSISACMFAGCWKLEQLILPRSVSAITDPLCDIYSLSTYSMNIKVLKVAEGNSYYDSRDNCNAIIETNTNTLIAGCINTIIPNSVTSIGLKAFENCRDLTSVTIPNSVTSIGGSAFYGCTELTSITIPNSVNSIGGRAFYGCSGLTSITIPNSLTSIGMYAFDGTAWYNNKPDGLIYAGKVAYKFKGLFPANTNIALEMGTLGIAEGAFSGCSGLTSIAIPNSVTSIGWGAFSGCNGLTSITIPISVTSIGSDAFDGCSGLTKVASKIKNPFKIDTSVFPSDIYTNAELVVPTGTKSLYEVTEGWNKFSKITESLAVKRTIHVATAGTLPNLISEGEKYEIDELTLTGELNGTDFKFINEMAGKNVSYAYNGPNDCEIIYNSTNGILRILDISNVKIVKGGGAYEWEDWGEALGYYTNDNTVSYKLFAKAMLVSVLLPYNVTRIESKAFSGCSDLISIIIPNSVTSIGNDAFKDCSGLRKVVSKIKNPFTIGSSVFPSDVYSNAELIVPAGTKSLYEATEGWNKFSKITEHLPTLETLPAQPTSTTKARLIALANEEDDDQHFGFEWLRNDAPANMPANKVSAPLYDGRIIGSLGGLNPDIYYKYRPFYKSDTGEMVYGEWIPFLTGDANVFFEPEVHTKDAVVSNDGALLSAVFVEGTEDIQEKGFEYWPMNSNARAVSLTRGDNIGSVIVSGNNTSVTIEGLEAGTEYGYRPYVKTASGTTYGEEKTFKTSLFGDVNGDNKVDSNDLNDLVSYIMGIIPPHFNKDVADLNNDNKVNAADIVKMVNILK